jgi:ferredoxin
MLTRQKLEDFILFLSKKEWEVFGTQKKDGILAVEAMKDPAELTLEKGVPFYSFKRFFIPEEEKLFEYKGHYLKPEQAAPKNTALIGMNLLDLKSILLYDQVFEKDPYYQARRRHTLVVGHSLIPDMSQNIFEQKFEEDVLEHLSFDIFLARMLPDKVLPKKGAIRAKNITEEKVPEEYAVFSGSALGQKILSEFGYKNYINIQFSGPVREGKLDERMLKIKDKLENKHNQKIWDELGARCIECGKCTVVCPTCFCFRIDDRASLGDGVGERKRCWDSCFYQEFSEVAAPSTSSGQVGHKFLNDTAKRIHFWYFHKFARIPGEFNFMGCVGCRRCAAVCPVGIDIAEVLNDIEKS